MRWPARVGSVFHCLVQLTQRPTWRGVDLLEYPGVEAGERRQRPPPLSSSSGRELEHRSRQGVREPIRRCPVRRSCVRTRVSCTPLLRAVLREHAPCSPNEASTSQLGRVPKMARTRSRLAVDGVAWAENSAKEMIPFACWVVCKRVSRRRGDWGEAAHDGIRAGARAVKLGSQTGQNAVDEAVGEGFPGGERVGEEAEVVVSAGGGEVGRESGENAQMELAVEEVHRERFTLRGRRRRTQRSCGEVQSWVPAPPSSSAFSLFSPSKVCVQRMQTISLWTCTHSRRRRLAQIIHATPSHTESPPNTGIHITLKLLNHHQTDCERIPDHRRPSHDPSCSSSRGGRPIDEAGVRSWKSPSLALRV